MDENKNQEPASQLSEPQTRPAAVVNGQSDKPTTPTFDSQYERVLVKKPSKWRHFFTDFFIALGVLQVLGVCLFLLVMTDLVQKAKDGASGTEFIALIVYITIVPTVGFAALINLIGLPIYIVKHRPRAVGLVVSVLSLLISLGLFLFAVNVFY